MSCRRVMLTFSYLFLASNSGEDRYDSCLQMLCGDSSGCERHLLIIETSRCPVSYACQISYQDGLI